MQSVDKVNGNGEKLLGDWCLSASNAGFDWTLQGSIKAYTAISGPVTTTASCDIVGLGKIGLQKNLFLSNLAPFPLSLLLMKANS